MPFSPFAAALLPRRSALVRRAAAVALATGLGYAISAWSAPVDPGAEYVHADLIAQQDGAIAGEAAVLGLRLRHAPHWHTYWAMPGDAGLPTRLTWRLADGYAGGPLQWPVPQLLRVGDLANYGYEGTVVLPIVVQVPAGAAPGTSAHFAAHVDWLVCNELCIPGGADLSIDLPLRAHGQLRPGTGADEIAAALRRVPAALQLAGAQAHLEGERVVLEFDGPSAAPRALAFFALEPGRIEAAALQAVTARGRRVRLAMRAATPVAEDFKALRGLLVADGGPGEPGGWAGTIDVPLARQTAAGGPAAASVQAGGAVLAAPREGAAAVTPAPPPAAAIALAPLAPPTAAPPADALTFALALVGALLGGVILNLMPCVFPVLSLKLMGLIRHRAESRERLRRHGAAFAAGVVLSFLVLAALLIGLRAAGAQIGWGFQLQSPLVVAGLVALFYLIGLNLLGAFEFTLGASLANRAVEATAGAADPDRAESLGGSFATGVLAAVVAAPCTAPFMGAALGFAVTQPAPVALLVFAALGVGMAAPYFVLTLMPAWLARLPRPGAWMEHLKQVMAFPMFFTCVWLIWVLGQQVDVDAVAALLAALVGAGFWAWATGLAQRGSPRYRWAAAAAAVAGVAMLAPLLRSAVQPAEPAPAVSVDAPSTPASAAAPAWSPWSPAAQSLALASGKPVFVDFTAAWCITCQANKRLVLRDERIEAAFRDHEVVRLKADWTRRDESISRELARLQRSGVPVYVLYDRHGAEHVLPEILSIQGLLAALAAV